MRGGENKHCFARLENVLECSKMWRSYPRKIHLNSFGKSGFFPCSSGPVEGVSAPGRGWNEMVSHTPPNPNQPAILWFSDYDLIVLYFRAIFEGRCSSVMKYNVFYPGWGGHPTSSLCAFANREGLLEFYDKDKRISKPMNQYCLNSVPEGSLSITSFWKLFIPTVRWILNIFTEVWICSWIIHGGKKKATDQFAINNDSASLIHTHTTQPLLRGLPLYWIPNPYPSSESWCRQTLLLSPQ